METEGNYFWSDWRICCSHLRSGKRMPYIQQQKITHPSYNAVSFTTGFTLGHIEYTRYKDSSQDVKIEPKWNYQDRLFYQDLDGDNVVDRIRINSGSTKSECLDTILVRENDYEKNKEQFDDADKTLRELAEKYKSQ
jgi:hypothetical protein